jgi:hypothetical protein
VISGKIILGKKKNKNQTKIKAMDYLTLSYDRPDRFENRKRDEKYHVDWGRYIVAASIQNPLHTDHLAQMSLNRNFFFDKQWFFEEDTESFFKDSSNQSKNRIKVTKNFIKPTVMQYLGNSIVMDLTVRASSISPKAVNRREQKLSELLYYSQVAQNSNPEFKEYLKTKLPIGDSPEETEEMFKHLYKDDFVEGINYFTDYISNENKFDRKRVIAALDLAITGMCHLEYYVHGQEFKWRRVIPEQFFFDRTAKEPDLSDAGFIGKYEDLLASDIFERHPHLSFQYKKAIEAHSKNTQQDTKGKLFTFTCYWKDFEDYEYGYVFDEFDYPYFTRINYTYSNEEKPRYTDKDLIPINKLSDNQKKITRGSNKAVIPVDILRWVEFIPNELLSAPIEGNVEKSDIVLDYGIYPYQDTELQTSDNVKFPIKTYTWIYYNGFVDTPISSLINPQRMINRYAAVEQQQVASSHGKTLLYDEQLLGGTTDEDVLLNNMYQGKPTKVSSRGLGIHNLAGELGTTIGNETLIYNELKTNMKGDMDQIIGVNQSMRGEFQGANKLVGVTQLEIQRSSLIQEPFYDAITQMFLDVYQATANVGKRVYINNRRKLSIMVGDDYAKILELTEEYNAEDFRVFIRREPDMAKQKEAANSLLFALRQANLIDETRMAKLFNNSTIDDIARGMREYAGEKMVMAKEQMKQQELQMQQEQIQQQGLVNQQNESQYEKEVMGMIDKEEDRKSKENQTILKLAGNQQRKR